MKIIFDLKANKYRLLPSLLKWHHQDAKKIKKRSSWISKVFVHSRNIDRYEIYEIVEKDRKTKTYWLIEHIIIEGTGEVGSGINIVETIPLYPIELIKQDKTNLEYWLVKRAGLKIVSKIL